MIICLEGPDGSGKTTLRKQLYKYYYEHGYSVCDNAESLVSTRPGIATKRVTEDELYITLKALMKSDTIFIMDRGPISDVIYRLFDNYPPVVSLDKLTDWLLCNTQFGFILIYCRNDKSRKMMRVRGDDNEIAIRNQDMIVKLYEMLLPTFKNFIPYHEYDWTNPLAFNWLLINIDVILNLKGCKDEEAE